MSAHSQFFVEWNQSLCPHDLTIYNKNNIFPELILGFIKEDEFTVNTNGCEYDQAVSQAVQTKWLPGLVGQIMEVLYMYIECRKCRMLSPQQLISI